MLNFVACKLASCLLACKGAFIICCVWFACFARLSCFACGDYLLCVVVLLVVGGLLVPYFAHVFVRLMCCLLFVCWLSVCCGFAVYFQLRVLRVFTVCVPLLPLFECLAGACLSFEAYLWFGFRLFLFLFVVCSRLTCFVCLLLLVYIVDMFHATNPFLG